jgi:hypothetical protein
VFRRRRPTSVDPEVAPAAAAFEVAFASVERARDSLLSAVPGRRGQRRPLAEALAGFESGLAEAARAMPGWRTARLEDGWRGCQAALAEATRRAEHLRLEASPEGYEALAPFLAALLEPLDAFEVAAATLRRLGA